MPVWVGTSGWMYRDWREVLYPAGCPQRLWLEEYAKRFITVENNGAFYRLPTAETFADWRDRTPDGFVMAVKASRYLTHIKRLREPQEPVERLMSRAGALGPRLGPVLLQLPPTLRAEPETVESLDACLAAFPTRTRVAVEPRHDSWWTDDVRALLERHGAALCWADWRARPTGPLWRTADWGYVRFHVGIARPWPRYGRQALTTWVRRITETWPDESDVYAYFNNDPGGAAVRDAETFLGLLSRSGEVRSGSTAPRRGSGNYATSHNAAADDRRHSAALPAKRLARTQHTGQHGHDQQRAQDHTKVAVGRGGG